VALNAPKPDEIPSGVQGNRDEAMTVRQREPVWELNPQRVGLSEGQGALSPRGPVHSPPGTRPGRCPQHDAAL